MRSKKGSYNLEESQYNATSELNDLEIPIVYRALSDNTQNALDKIQPDGNLIVRSRHNSLVSSDALPIKEIENAIIQGFIETSKDIVSTDTLATYTASFERRKSIETIAAYVEQRSRKKSLTDIVSLNKAFKTGEKSYEKCGVDFAINDHLLTFDEFMSKHQTNLKYGLTSQEVEKRRLDDGPNLLKKRRKKSPIMGFIKELIAGFNLIMWAAAILSFICWQPLGGKHPDVTNLALACLLFGAILFQAVFTFLQQRGTDNLMASFEKLMPHKTTAHRDGKWESINTWELVRGDVIRITAGDKIPADIRIIDCSQASVEKSALTGESEPIKLNVDSIDCNPYETKNIAFFGSSLLEGTATGVVFNIGEHTLMGKIARLTVKTRNEMTTMQKEINYFAIIIATMAFVTGVVTFLVWRFGILSMHPKFLTYSDILIACIGLIVSFMPAGITISVTMTLKLTAKKMKKINVLVKNMRMIETLGSTTVIASDKTGTITMNKMSLSNLSVLSFEFFNCLGSIKESINDHYKYLLTLAGLCNKSIVESEGDQAKSSSFIGSPTECGILKGALEYVDIKAKRIENPLVFEIPFNSRYKYHLTIHKLNTENAKLVPESLNNIKTMSSGANHLVIIKGAPEIIAELCTLGVNGNKIEQFLSIKSSYLEKAFTLASNGERVLAIAFAFLSLEKNNYDIYNETNLPQNLCFAGLLSLIDPPRTGVAEAVTKCHDGGIKVMMVTGDHPLTAISIAKMVNIITCKSVKNFEEVKHLIHKSKEKIIKSSSMRLKLYKKLSFLSHYISLLLPNKANVHAKHYDVNGAIVVTSRDIAEFEIEDWDYVLSHDEIVFARTTPQNKLAIVQNLQRRGEVVTVTGDGVNDAPALKKADIGIAMGIAGTEISKEAAKIIIMDDNFSTIVNGIEQGRLLFDNLKKVIAYLIPAGSFSEILPVLAYVFLGLPLPLTTLQMAVLCIGTDALGSIGLVYEHPESDIMKRKPRNTAVDHLISLPLILKIYFQTGLMESFIAFFTYFYTMHTFNVDTHQLLFSYDKWNSPNYFAGVDAKTRASALTHAQTGFFVALVMCQLINLLTTRTRFQSFFKQRFRPSILLFMLGEICIVVLFCYIPPLQPILGSTNAQWYHFIIPLAMALSIFAVDEVKKLLIRRFPKSFIRHFAY